MNEKEQSKDKIVEFDASTFSANDALAGTILGGHLKILNCIGSGGMSVVYKAEDLLLQRTVAVKILHSHSALNPQNVLRFRQEAMAASKIDHQNVIRIYEFNVPEQGQPYLVMDFIEGLSLADFIDLNGPIEMRRAVSLMGIICDGLQRAHEAGVVHRDLKPGNIMLLKDSSGKQTLKIVDFGIAKVLTEDANGHALTQTGEVFGSPLYMSPEQCYGKPLDNRSDLYSLGCVMYEMCTGNPPIKGSSLLETIQLQTTDPPPAAESKYSGIKYGAQFDAVIRRAMAKNPDERFQTALEFKEALEGMFDAPQSTGDRSGPGQIRPVAVASGCALVLLLAIVWMCKDLVTPAPIPLAMQKPTAPAPTQVSQNKNQTIPTPVSPKTTASPTGDPSTAALLESERQSTDADLKRLYQKPRAKRPTWLRLEQTRITDDGLKVIANDQGLLRLQCASSEITDASGKTVGSLTNLQRLDISDDKIGDQFLKSLSSLKHLEHFWCTGTPITDKGLSYLKSMPLHNLNLTKTNVGNAGMEYLGKLPLQTLVLNETKVGNDGLANLSTAPLVDLRLTETAVTGAGLRHLVHIPSLVRLHTGRNKIGSEGISHIKKMTGLKYLGVEEAGLRDEDVREIAALKNLLTLNIGYNSLSELSMKYVSELPHLQSLRIAKSNIPAQAIRQYKLTHPHVTINEKENRPN